MGRLILCNIDTKSEWKAAHRVKVYFAKCPILTEGIMMTLFKREDEKMAATLKKSVYKSACELQPDMTPAQAFEWGASITPEVIGTSCKNGNKSYRDTMNRIKKVAKLPDETKKLENFKLRGSKNEISILIEGFTCKMIASVAHQSDIRIIQEIQRSIKEESQGWKQENEMYKKAFEDFEKSPIATHFEATCRKQEKGESDDTSQKPKFEQEATKTGRGKDAKALATAKCLEAAKASLANFNLNDDQVGQN